jgi:hypothetical protein
MSNAAEVEAYNRREIRQVAAAFKAMDDQATKEAQETGGALAEFLRGKIIQKSYGRAKASAVARGISEGSRVAKSSKVGELSIGFASQRFSGGGSTKELWGGMEFGSKKFSQFPTWNPQGWFIYPALRENQKDLVRQWEERFARIVERFGV